MEGCLIPKVAEASRASVSVQAKFQLWLKQSLWQVPPNQYHKKKEMYFL